LFVLVIVLVIDPSHPHAVVDYDYEHRWR